MSEAPIEKPDIPISLMGDKRMFIPITALKCSIRTYNCLNKAHFSYVGQIVGLHPSRRKFQEIRMKHFGIKSRNELQEVLQDMGLDFGMYQIPGHWIPHVRYDWKEHENKQYGQRIKDVQADIAREMHEAFQAPFDSALSLMEAYDRAQAAITGEPSLDITDSEFLCRLSIGPDFNAALAANPALANKIAAAMKQAAFITLERHFEK